MNFEDLYMSKCENEYVDGVVVDVCSRSFLLLGDQGSEKMVECDDPVEFMAVLEFVSSRLDSNQVEYADIAVSVEV